MCLFRVALLAAFGIMVGTAAEADSGSDASFIQRTGNKVVLQSAPFSSIWTSPTDFVRSVGTIASPTASWQWATDLRWSSTSAFPANRLQRPTCKWRRFRLPAIRPVARRVFELVSQSPKAVVTVTYRWDAKQPILHKYAVSATPGRSHGTGCDVRLGASVIDAVPTQDLDWPVRLTKIPWGCVEWDSWSIPPAVSGATPPIPRTSSLQAWPIPRASPCWTTGIFGCCSIPGVRLEATKEFVCMEAVYGVAHPARRAAFCVLHSRMRRVLRGHDRPYSIISTCGAQDGTEDFFAVSEETCLKHITHMAEAQHDTGLHWDFYDIEFWHDPAGNLMAPDIKRFPHGFGPVFSALANLGDCAGAVDQQRLLRTGAWPRPVDLR